MSLWDTLTQLVATTSPNYAFVPIRADHAPDGSTSGKPLEAGASYFRLWLTQMVLAHNRTWFQSWQPAIHSVVRFDFGGKTVEIPHVVGPLSLPGVDASNLGNVVQLNYPLTALMPFNGGTVSIEAGLLALQGANLLAEMLKV